MIFFEGYFPDIDFSQANAQGEVAVRCPFPHAGLDGKPYYEHIPSAHINVEKSVFHCKVCDRRHSEASFMAEKAGIDYAHAIKILNDLEHNHIKTNWSMAVANLKGNDDLIKNLKISEFVRNELKIGFEGEGISFPVYVYGQLMDVRKYRPGQTPKVMSRPGASAGYFIPDITTMHDLNTIYLCAGEKDMSSLRSIGFDAYTLTGGEQMIPRVYGYAFKGKKVYILYDNDQTGIDGANRMAVFVYEQGGIPYVVTGHHLVATEKGGDIWDYLVKYGKTRNDFIEMIHTVQPVPQEALQIEQEKEIPVVNLQEALQPKHRKKYVTSHVQVTGVYNQTFGIPNVLEVEKTASGDAKPASNLIPVGTKLLYSIDEDNNEDILYMMDSNLKDVQVEKNILGLCKIPSSESGIVIKERSHATIYKATISNYGGDSQSINELDVYSFEPLENGRKYKITFKPVQHPLRQQEIVLIAKKIVGIENELSNFKLDKRVKEELKLFQVKHNETVEMAMDRLFELDKGYIGAEANKNIVQTVDLVYHSPLHLQIGKKTIRGTIDAFMVGETRTGKSHTSKIKRNLYDLGSVINLGTTTVAGLIGGTNKATNKTKIGLLPREHKNLVILEEFSSMQDGAFIKSMTEIRSSNEVRIVRVDTDLRVPCQLRMLTISNPKNHSGGGNKSLKSYPNGIEVLLELIDGAEDIARYDFFTLVPEPDQYASFLDVDYEKLPESAYRSRVRWAWTRTVEQIKLDQATQQHLWDVSMKLNKEFNTHVRLFGTEAWMKLARIAVSCAMMVVSTDDTFNNVIVRKEHVDWAEGFLRRIYDNKTFKLKEFVDEQRKYSVVDDALIESLQSLYDANSTMLGFLETQTSVSRGTLRDVSGKSNEDFSMVLNEMSRLYLFQWTGNMLVPSERFRKALQLIDKTGKKEVARRYVL